LLRSVFLQGQVPAGRPLTRLGFVEARLHGSQVSKPIIGVDEKGGTGQKNKNPSDFYCGEFSHEDFLEFKEAWHVHAGRLLHFPLLCVSSLIKNKRRRIFRRNVIPAVLFFWDFKVPIRRTQNGKR